MIYPGMEYRRALRQTVQELSGLTNSQNQARWLVCQLLGCPLEKLIISSSLVNEKQADALNQAIARLLTGYPLQYLLGNTQFMGLPFCVREKVLIPRNDTEILAKLAVDWVGESPARVLDLCCGSGCLGVSIGYYCKKAQVVCGDISSYAVSLTKENAAKNQVRVQVVESDLFSAIIGRFDLIVCNPPYVCREEPLPREVRYEPRLALFGGIDGLDFYRRLNEEAFSYVNPGGRIMLEIGADQGRAVQAIFGGGRIETDLNGRDRVILLESREERV